MELLASAPVGLDVLRAPKAGSAAAEYEDAAASDPRRGRYAVADGATSSFGAGSWAQLLVNAWCDDPPSRPADVRRWIEGAARGWDPEPAENAAWYVDEAARRGSFATLIGLEIRSHRTKLGFAWRSMAVGDSCLVQVRRGRRVKLHPDLGPADFDSTPALLATDPAFHGLSAEQAQFRRGFCRPGDVFLLMTDAVAEWALKAESVTPDVWSLLASVDHDTFEARLERLRHRVLIANDDVTVLRCPVAAAVSNQEERSHE